MMRENDTVAKQQKEEKEALNQEATAGVRRARERKRSRGSKKKAIRRVVHERERAETPKEGRKYLRDDDERDRCFRVMELKEYNATWRREGRRRGIRRELEKLEDGLIE